MEHRGSPRIDVDRRVELIKADRSRQVARVKNISIVGFFLAVDPDGFRLYESLAVVVTDHETYRLNGQLVRLTDKGIAIELDADNKTLTHASRLLRSLKCQEAAAEASPPIKLVKK